jgi:2-polyprenyl-6-methoxyphenol hydroxylase-like FAD-dependent oxidoreductase
MAHAAADVLIVGAGPVGLLLAGDLAAAGVPVTVLERRTDASNLSRAIGVEARTLEMLECRGLADELVATGQRVDRLSWGSLNIDLSRLPSRFPFQLRTPQHQTERVLERRARSLGAEIIGGSEVTGLLQDADHVRLDVRAADGTVTTREALYVVGCDGFDSTVRRQLGLPFPGQSVLRSVMLADVRLSDPPPDLVQARPTPAGFGFIAPSGHGWYRVLAWSRENQLPDSEPADLAEIRDITRQVFGTDFGMHDALWTSRFRSDERQVPSYRCGRVFLAGDAAHEHSPFGGMGMNTGLQDAANLSWKIAATLGGWAADSLLDSYHAERYPVGRSVLRMSGSLMRLAKMEPGPRRQAVTLAAAAVSQIRPLADEVGRHLSGVAIHYPRHLGDHPLVGRRMPDVPLAGQRGRLYLLLRSGRFALLAGEAQELEAASSWAGRVDAAVRTRTQPRLILVRPDGYIAWACDHADPARREAELRAALAWWCGAPATRSATAPPRAEGASAEAAGRHRAAARATREP